MYVPKIPDMLVELSIEHQTAEDGSARRSQVIAELRRGLGALSFPFLPLSFCSILLAWANAVRRGNAPSNFYFSMT